MIDQADKKCGLLFKQSEASEFHIEGRHQISVTLECASRSLTNKWTPRSHRDVSWISFALKMLALLHPIISDCHCIVFDRRILSAFCSQWITAPSEACILFSITQMTFTGPGGLSLALISQCSCFTSPRSSHTLFCGGVRGGGELIVWQTQARAQSSPPAQECEAAPSSAQKSDPTGSQEWQNKSSSSQKRSALASKILTRKLGQCLSVVLLGWPVHFGNIRGSRQ